MQRQTSQGPWDNISSQDSLAQGRVRVIIDVDFYDLGGSHHVCHVHLVGVHFEGLDDIESFLTNLFKISVLKPSFVCSFTLL